jgi:hypothetical protein
MDSHLLVFNGVSTQNRLQPVRGSQVESSKSECNPLKGSCVLARDVVEIVLIWYDPSTEALSFLVCHQCDPEQVSPEKRVLETHWDLHC